MWDVETTETFDNWFDAQTVALKEDLLAAMLILAEYGPQLGRPFADTVNDSQFFKYEKNYASNIRETRYVLFLLSILRAVALYYVRVIKRG